MKIITKITGVFVLAVPIFGAIGLWSVANRKAIRFALPKPVPLRARSLAPLVKARGLRDDAVEEMYAGAVTR